MALPLDCTLGETCFIEDYVDADPGPGTKDYTCGIKSRDAHRGTDIVLASHAAMEAGINVLAAADGLVEAVRDGVPDRAYSAEVAKDVQGQECGNAVRIGHENGLQTLYCHMKQGSVAVKPGDIVATGTPLGQVGMSGKSNIPHVHISVLKDGQVIDPFAPEAGQCGTDQPQLWETPIAYEPTGFITAGFSDNVPSFDDVRSGAARRAVITRTQPLVLYAYFHDAQRGDILTITATGPDGQAFEHSELLKDPHRAMFRASGKRAPNTGWSKGDYRGIATLTRKGRLIGWRHADVTVE
ncbi:M23 family metallopeptidase [Pseudoprimorskyibacter insulae]|uniref:M23 family metallopeptidase n=1 Tax=Pseudoprimorskyibacter insulae TaxID=1695997 RepID=UPI001FEA3684|nr:M23 family metallopeptidase [Pseudoprimorskyibacter insulae]